MDGAKNGKAPTRMDDLGFLPLFLETPIYSPKLTVRPEKRWDWKSILSYWVLVTFQGRTVKVREGK